jgi:hypothetical protein
MGSDGRALRAVDANVFLRIRRNGEGGSGIFPAGLRAKMKKLIFVILIAVFAFAIRQKSIAGYREKLVGTWLSEQTLPGGIAARVHINFKPDGNFYMVGDAAKGGRTAFVEDGGKWQMMGKAFKLDFTRKTIPGIDYSKLYGGSIVKLDEKTLSYRCKEGVETWKRLQ